MKALVILLLSLGLVACATTVPSALQAPGEALTVAQAQEDALALRGQVVRWGGEILSVHNRDDHTELVVLRRPLFDNAEPQPEGGEAKRFIARFEGFLDPAEWRPGQRLTVRGRLDGVQVLMVGDYPYAHPVVRAEASHRWPPWQPPQEPPWHRDPFYCDPLWPRGPRPYPGSFCW
ncbi:Slp/YeaY family lipoprotein [endosymbiont of unidentified scaly snail isolate Monju]|uniref:Slp/YeaY family lipoprotein n=1 Tax=endosymbiont of unidentified scaly snail isolate Monju TaxID=1248727 RepID=UPI0003891B71|nr:Slp/YeaY family lipoprotein [endosymbiont of unidentified scaly snail isolate Monju]BAN69978.1 outer membrane lipoprotein [endosymbiont of unidentified scaly snail isolate Monju]